MSAVIEAVQRVNEAVEKIKNDSPQDFPIAANVGDAVRQGDIYIQLIDPLTAPPKFYTKLAAPAFPLQLAPGNTKGSRHCLEHSDGIEVYVPDTDLITAGDSVNDEQLEMAQNLRQKIFDYASEVSKTPKAIENRTMAYEITEEITSMLALAGPIFVLKNPTTVSHPEHGNWNLPAGTYRCVFQRTVSSTDNSIRRVLD